MPKLKSCLLIMGVTIVVAAEGFIQPKGGIAIPIKLNKDKADRGSEKIAWNIGFEWGGIFDNRVGFGGSFDMYWQKTVYDSLLPDTSVQFDRYTIDREHKRFLFPLNAFFFIDPIPEVIVHPVIRGAFGPAMMIYVDKKYDDGSNDAEYTDPSGVYWGFTGRVGGDMHVNFGPESSIFFGFEYQWAALNRKEWRKNIYYHQDMQGPVFRIGFRFI
ncbi:MAG: hypothetical protein GF398_03455 [Chitinivibrionales bacterium]|nr:hypothetical protein [Chitinivibrionales bacterium]